MTKPYTIQFDLPLEQTSIVVRLSAKIELHHPDPYYIVSDIRTASQTEGSILPPIKIRKRQGKWVHLDIDKETDLSEVVGCAIEAFESLHKPVESFPRGDQQKSSQAFSPLSSNPRSPGSPDPAGA